MLQNVACPIFNTEINKEKGVRNNMNKEGQKLFNKWEKVYESELNKLRKEMNDEDYIEGWCIIDDYEHVKTIEDEVGLLIFGYDDYLPNYFDEWREHYDEDEVFFTDFYGKDYTLKEVEELAMKYYEDDKHETDSND
jgi:hypothetical protein